MPSLCKGLCKCQSDCFRCSQSNARKGQQTRQIALSQSVLCGTEHARILAVGGLCVLHSKYAWMPQCNDSHRQCRAEKFMLHCTGLLSSNCYQHTACSMTWTPWVLAASLGYQKVNVQDMKTACTANYGDIYPRCFQPNQDSHVYVSQVAVRIQN